MTTTMTQGSNCASCGAWVPYDAQHTCMGLAIAPSTETRADPLSPAEVRQIVREELERFHGARIQPSIHSPACAMVRFGEAECDCGAPREAETAPDHWSRTITSLCDRLDRIYLIALDRSLHANERLIWIRRETEGFAKVAGEKA